MLAWPYNLIKVTETEGVKFDTGSKYARVCQVLVSYPVHVCNILTITQFQLDRKKNFASLMALWLWNKVKVLKTSIKGDSLTEIIIVSIWKTVSTWWQRKRHRQSFFCSITKRHQRMARPGVRQVLEDSGEQGKMDETGCEIICGAPTTLAVKGEMRWDDDEAKHVTSYA